MVLIYIQRIIRLSIFFPWTPLHRASKKGHLSVVEYLVNQKAEMNVKNKDGKTPLLVAS